MIIPIRKYTPKIIKRCIRGTEKSIKHQIAHMKLKKLIDGSSKRKIYLIGTPIHGNLGDQAIAYAEMKFLLDNCKEFDVFEVQYNDLNLEKLNKVIGSDDLLMLHGGGNIGIEYLYEEELRRRIITTFEKQKIIIFPQTLYFGNSDLGRSELEKTRKIYNAHRDLTIIAREKVSFNIMKDIFNNNNVILTPDIVMYLNQSELIEERKDILFCLRNDKERIVSSDFKQCLYEKLSLQNNIIITDTVVKYHIKKDKREDELNKIWSSFRKSKLVITDRLHGMVFAAITSTPCIALSNYNQKVKGTYEWIKHLPFIRFIEDENDIFMHIDELLKMDMNEYDNNFAKDSYKKIVKSIYNSEEGIIPKNK